MWYLFDKYKGVVWPKAGQMNLIARILNNLCQGTGIKLETPTNPSPSAPVSIGIDTEWLDDHIGKIPSGGGGDGGGGMFAWTPPAEGATTGTMGVGGVMVGRKWITATGTGSGKAVGVTYSVKITLSASSASAEVVSGVSVGTSPSGNISYIPIYTIGSDGKISADYRGAFVVPAYE